MRDPIERQAAIDALEELKIRYFDRKVIIGKTQDVINNLPSAQPDFSCDGCKTPKHICGICMRNYPNITDHYCTGEWTERREE